MSATKRPRRPKNLGKIHGFIAGLVALALVSGCSLVAREQSSTASETTVLLPWVSDGKYHWERVTLESLISIPNLQGTAALFLLSPSQSSSKLVGFQPRVRTFVDGDGASVPTDAFSIQLLTLYAHIEKLGDLDAKLGLGSLLPKPRVVGVEVRIPSQQMTRDLVQNNALYSPALDALLFVPFKGGDLPLAVNGGVIAHEYFHALFNFMVLKSVRERIKVGAAHVHPEEEKTMAKAFPNLGEKITVPDLETTPDSDWEMYHENLLRGMNEGLADVWGWIYTGDNVFVKRSLPVLQKSRDLDVKAVAIQDTNTFRAYTNTMGAVGQQSDQAYKLASQYARAITSIVGREFAKDKESRLGLAKMVIEVLPKIEQRFKSVDTMELVRPSELLDMFAEVLAPTRPEVCAELMTLASDISEADQLGKCGASATEIEAAKVRDEARRAAIKAELIKPGSRLDENATAELKLPEEERAR